MTDSNNPFDGLEKQFERFQRQFEAAMSAWELDRLGSLGSESMMGIDLVDQGDEFVLTADVPGFDSDEIDIRISDATLSIMAEREEATQQQEELYLKSERAHRAISRSVRLPEPVDEESVSAAYNNGVLTLTLPKMRPTDVSDQKIEID